MDFEESKINQAPKDLEELDLEENSENKGACTNAEGRSFIAEILKFLVELWKVFDENSKNLKA